MLVILGTGKLFRCFYKRIKSLHFYRNEMFVKYFDNSLVADFIMSLCFSSVCLYDNSFVNI